MAVEVERRDSISRDEAGHTRTYQIFGERLLVLSESAEMKEHIHCFMKCLEVDMCEPDARLVIFRSRAGSEEKLLLCSPEFGMTYIAQAGRDAWFKFRHVFFRLLLESCRDDVLMHASAIADRDGRAAVISGLSNAGKTSILLALLQQGFAQAADDYCVMKVETHGLMPLPVGATVTEHTLDLFPSIRELIRPSCSFFSEGCQQWTIDASSISDQVPPTSELRPTHFFFLSPSFGSASRIEELDRAEAQYWLQEGRFQPDQAVRLFGDPSPEVQKKRFALTRSLAAQAKFYRVVNGNVHEAASLISEAFQKS
jgi:hypothetical protein